MYLNVFELLHFFFFFLEIPEKLRLMDRQYVNSYYTQNQKFEI